MCVVVLCVLWWLIQCGVFKQSFLPELIPYHIHHHNYPSYSPSHVIKYPYHTNPNFKPFKFTSIFFFFFFQLFYPLFQTSILTISFAFFTLILISFSWESNSIHTSRILESGVVATVVLISVIVQI